MKEQGLHDRLRLATGERTYREIGKQTGTHAESVRRYMQGQSPSVEFLTNVCEAFGVNGDWLLTGQGPVHQSEIRDHALRQAGTPDLLRAMSDTIGTLIQRVDRLERFVQTVETRIRANAATGGVDGRRSDGGAADRRTQGPAERIADALPERPPRDAD